MIQTAQNNRNCQSLYISVSLPTQTDASFKSMIVQHCLKAIAGEVENKLCRSIILLL